MLKKIRKNKKGFTLVELIVVIVIILVLSAVMVPNVLKYIDKANQANTKAEAATMLVQVQAEVAETFATASSAAPTMPTVSLDGVTASHAATFTAYSAAGSEKKATYTVDLTAGSTTLGSVTGFAYQDGKHYINWTSTTGWSDVDKAPAAAGTGTGA